MAIDSGNSVLNPAGAAAPVVPPQASVVAAAPSEPAAPEAWYDNPAAEIYNVGNGGPYDAKQAEFAGLDPANPWYTMAGGAPTNIVAPDYATAAGLDPGSFYAVYNQFQNPDIRDQWVAGMQSANQARLDTEGDMAPVIEELRRRGDPNFDFITATQQLGAQQQVAQQYARGASAAEASAAGRGTAFGGASMGRNQALQSFADATGLQVQGNIDATNQQARNTAIDTLARTLSQRQYEPTDFAPFLELDRQRTAQIEIDAELDEAIAKADADIDEFTWDDVAPIMQISHSPLLGDNGRKDMMLAMVREGIGEGWETHEIYLQFMQMIYPGRFDAQGNLKPQWAWMMGDPTANPGGGDPSGQMTINEVLTGAAA